MLEIHISVCFLKTGMLAMMENFELKNDGYIKCFLYIYIEWDMEEGWDDLSLGQLCCSP